MKRSGFAETNHFKSYATWLSEFVGTGVVMGTGKGRKKPKKGCGYNIWGTPGNVAGTEIDGEIPKGK